MRRTRIVSSVVEPLPLPGWVVAAIDLKVANAPLCGYRDTVADGYHGTAGCVAIGSVIHGERIPPRLELGHV